MAEVDDLARVQQAHHAALLGLRSTAGGLVEDAFDAYADLDDAGLAAFSTEAARISRAAQDRTAVLASGYLSANDAILGEGGPVSIPTPTIRNGVPAEDVYARSIVEARARVARGMPAEQALTAARSRAASTARTDVILSNRASVAAGAEGRPHVVGYRRVLTGKSCALCATASTQRYKRADLQPIHPSCDCDVAEIYGTADPGQVLNQQLLDDLQAAAKEDGRPDYWKGPYVVDESGAVRYAKTEYVKAPDGSRLLGPNGKPVRRTVPGDEVKPRVRKHGELGETLTDRRHDFADADVIGSVELPTPAARAARPPAATGAVDDLARTPSRIATEAAEEAPTARIKPTDPTSNSVQREALRRNVSPEQVAAERDAKKIQAAIDRRAERAARKAISVETPEVIEAAARYGVSPDEVIATLARVPEVRKEIAEAATRAQADVFDRLYAYEIRGLQRPPARGARDAFGTELRTGGWDFLETLDARERARLSRQWYTDAPTDAPDQIFATMKQNGYGGASIDEAMAEWLRLNRTYEATGALRRGKIPSDRAYSGSIDIDSLLDLGPARYRVSEILDASDFDAAAAIARSEAGDLADDAFRYLGNATNPQHGPSPYRMSFQAWEEEVRELEYGLREYPSEMPRNARARLAELVPDMIDEPGTDFEELYARIVTTARQAGEEVPDYARIPWE